MTKFAVLLPLIAFTLSGCDTKPIAQPLKQDVSIPCGITQDYFPPENVTGTGAFNGGQFEEKWESARLRSMHEPSLYSCDSSKSEPQYRFIWDRSLSEPIVVRLVLHSKGAGTLYVHEITHHSSGPSEDISAENIQKPWFTQPSDKSIELSKGQVRHAIELFNRIPFPHGRIPVGESTDGSDWIFEASNLGRYELADFRNTQPDAAHQFGLYLVLNIAKLPIPQEAIY